MLRKVKPGILCTAGVRGFGLYHRPALRIPWMMVAFPSQGQLMNQAHGGEMICQSHMTS